jgi:hypothetical protein
VAVSRGSPRRGPLTVPAAQHGRAGAPALLPEYALLTGTALLKLGWCVRVTSDGLCDKPLARQSRADGLPPTRRPAAAASLSIALHAVDSRLRY